MAHRIVRDYIARKRIQVLRSRLAYLDRVIAERKRDDKATHGEEAERSAMSWAIGVLSDLYEPNPTQGA